MEGLLSTGPTPSSFFYVVAFLTLHHYLICSTRFHVIWLRNSSKQTKGDVYIRIIRFSKSLPKAKIWQV